MGEIRARGGNQGLITIKVDGALSAGLCVCVCNEGERQQGELFRRMCKGRMLKFGFRIRIAMKWSELFVLAFEGTRVAGVCFVLMNVSSSPMLICFYSFDNLLSTGYNSSSLWFLCLNGVCPLQHKKLESQSRDN